MKQWSSIFYSGVATFVCCAALMCGHVYAATQIEESHVYFYDEGELLSDDETEEVVTLLQDTADTLEMDLGVYLGSTPLGEHNTISLCDDTYDEIFGINSDGVFLYLDLSDEDDLYDHISTSGAAQFYFSNAEECDRISEIFEEMNPYLSRGAEQPVEAITAYCDALTAFYQMGIPDAHYYVYDDDRDAYGIYEDGKVQWKKELPDEYQSGPGNGVILLLSAVIGIIAGCITLLLIWRAYRFKSPNNTSVYLQSRDVHFSQRQDHFIRQYHTRTKISTDNHHSVGGSSHMSSFGGSHGGGGNHR